MTVDNAPQLTARTYAGLFLITFATLMYQVLLTRIFSVTMWYHFAFMAVSIAMFGLTVGALVVYLLPKVFTNERANAQIAQTSLAFTVTTVISFLIHANVPFIPERNLVGLLSVAFTYLVISIPFFFSGVAVTLALTRFPRRVSSLYAVDLAGASLGCIAVVVLLNVTDGPMAIFATAVFAALGTVLFALESRAKVIVAVSVLAALALGVIAGIGTQMQARQTPLVQLRYGKDKTEHSYDRDDIASIDEASGEAWTRMSVLYERWNAYSNVKVLGDPEEAIDPLGWGISDVYTRENLNPQLHMVIDNSAGTVLTKWDGKNLEAIDYLKYDVVNLAHHLRRDASTLAIGVGGGRDILSALAFDQKHVTGVEINGAIISMLKERFYEFTGRLASHPKVELVNDEARSYLARTTNKYDVLQVSLIDTWAATAAGAFVLSESGLYTKEAWDMFLDRLEPNGILTFSRWYYKQRPAEAWRLTGLAAESLKARGIENPRLHLLAAANPFRWGDFRGDYLVMTLLVSNEPFTREDIDRFVAVCNEMKFEVVLTPDFARDETFALIASPGDRSDFYNSYDLNIAPPTDDNAFFFHMVRLQDIFNRELLSQSVVAFNNKALTVLGLLLITVLVLTVLCVFVPLALTSRQVPLAGAFPHFVYFAGIGVGFMVIEISQMQRLNIFLGHPVYSLTVVLFALLLSSGIGSFLTAGVTEESVARSGVWRLGALVAVLALFGFATPPLIEQFSSSPTWLRLLVATAIVMPIGVLMGMAFPLGLKMAERQGRHALMPWLWGMNGAFSVVASVATICITIFSGVTVAFWIGFATYVAVFLAFMVNARRASG